jgi:hypothetical protein
MRGSDLGPSGPPPSEGRTNRGDSRLKRIVLLVGVLGAFVMLAVGAISAGALVGIGSDAVAETTPQPMDFACALKSNGLMRYVTEQDPCKKSEQSVTIKPGVLTCVQPDGSVRKVSNFANCKPPAVQLTLPPASGTVHFCAANSTGVLRYVTDPSQCTSSEFPVFVTNPPVANDTTASTNEDTAVTITLSGTDRDGDNLTFETGQPANGQLGPVVPTGPTTATVTYMPNLNYNGSDSFTYKAKDGNGGEDTAKVDITVSSVNDAPSFTAGDNVTVNEDSGAYSAAQATGISPGPVDEAGQTVSFNVSNDNPALFSSQPAISSDGTLTFTPAPNAFGTANVTVVAQDNGGIANGGNDTSAPQTFTITVNAVNDEPSFTAGGDVTVNEDSGAYDATWATAISAGPNESGQTVSFVVSNNNNALFSVQPAISSDGTLTFTPEADAFGSATVTVYLMDSGGIANGGDDTSPTQTFTITVTGVI